MDFLENSCKECIYYMFGESYDICRRYPKKITLRYRNEGKELITCGEFKKVKQNVKVVDIVEAAEKCYEDMKRDE